MPDNENKQPEVVDVDINPESGVTEESMLNLSPYLMDADKIENIEDVREVIRAMSLQVLWDKAADPERFRYLEQRGIVVKIEQG